MLVKPHWSGSDCTLSLYQKENTKNLRFERARACVCGMASQVNNSNYRPQRSCSKVMFLHLSVILFTGGVCHTPLGRHPPEQTPSGRHPPGRPPLGRQPPWTDNLPGQTPPGRLPRAYIPPAQCMLGYGQQAGGTHPTGMQSCFDINSKRCCALYRLWEVVMLPIYRFMWVDFFPVIVFTHKCIYFVIRKKCLSFCILCTWPCTLLFPT